MNAGGVPNTCKSSEALYLNSSEGEEQDAEIEVKGMYHKGVCRISMKKQ